jgi:protein-glutamine gamma-glutamyltransferase
MNATALPRVVLACLLGAHAGLAFGPVFGGVPGPARFLVAAGTAAGAGLVVAVLAALLPRVPAPAAVLGGTAAVAAAIAVVARPGAAVADGPRQLLTGAIPAPAQGPGLAAVAAVAGWTTLAAGLLAAYATGPLPAVLPPLACLVTALALGAAGPPLPGWYAPVAVALVAALLAARPSRYGAAGPSRPGAASPTRPGAAGPSRPGAASPSRPGAAGPSRRGGSAGRRVWSPARLASIALAGVAAVLAAAVVAPAAPGASRRPPADVRSLVAAPVLPRTGTSPLQQYLSLRNDDTALRLTGTASRPGSPLRMVTLTRFDGTYWTVDGDYRRAGTVLPAGSDPGAAGTTVRQQITVTAGDLAWLPSVGRPLRISVPDLGVDQATGDVINPAGRPAVASYSTTSVVYDPPASQVEAATPARIASGLTLPPRVRAFADLAVLGRPPGAGQLFALRDRLAADRSFRYDQAEEVDGGHGLYQIDRLLQRQRGTSEQYASAFAVMARYLGYDARVVMGFRPEYDRARPASFVVSGRDVDAWVEVRFDRLGWVTFDPSPRDNPIGTRAGAPPPAAQQAEPDEPDDDQTADPASDAAAAPSNRDSHPSRSTSGGRRVLVVAAVAGLALLVLASSVPMAKAVRRYRRRRGKSTRMVVLGAWREVLDRLREAGIPARPALTTGEVLTLVQGRAAVVPAALTGLAAMADRAGYAPEDPGESAGRDAWLAARTAHHEIGAGLPLLRRIGSAFDPRTLLPLRTR